MEQQYNWLLHSQGFLRIFWHTWYSKIPKNVYFCNKFYNLPNRATLKMHSESERIFFLRNIKSLTFEKILFQPMSYRFQPFWTIFVNILVKFTYFWNWVHHEMFSYLVFCYDEQHTWFNPSLGHFVLVIYIGCDFFLLG